MTEVNLQQPSKHQFPKLVTDDGMVMEVSPEFTKHQFPKLVTDEGMVIEVKLSQFKKQLSPKLVTDDGIVIDFKLWQSLKQLFPNSVTGYVFPSQVISAGITISDWV